MPEGGYKKFPLHHFFSSETGNFDIQAKHLNNIGEYVVSSGVSNNGIVGRSDVEAKIFPAQSITVDMFGNAFFQRFPYKLVTHARVFSLLWKYQVSEFDELVGLYFVCLLSKLSQIFSYSNMASWSKIKNFEIPLPVDSNGEIDLEFIRSRMRELEELRMRELEAYLSEAGFDDCTLTVQEEQALNSKPLTAPFLASNLFRLVKGKRLTKADMIPGSTPFIGATAANNGRTAFISNNLHIHEPNTITVSYNGSVGEAFYQTEPFWASDDINVFYGRTPLTENSALFYITLIRRLGKRYEYAAKWTKDKMENEILQMPINESGCVDYEYISNFINAIKKIIIASLKENIGIEQSNYMRAVNS